MRPSQWALPVLLAFFVVSGLYEHSPTPVIWVEALAPAIVPAAVAVNVHFWARALTLKRRTHALACLALYPQAGPHGGRPRQRPHHTATPATAVGQRASCPPRQWPQPLRSHPPALQWPSQG